MLGQTLQQFLRDERGGYTLWSLVWFMLYLVIGGLSVDVTDAYRNKTLLQSTADAAALAAIMSVGIPGEDPIAQANTFAAANMDPNIHGDVLSGLDVIPGVWDFGTETFTPLASPPNAVHVVTRRGLENSNPVAMNFLRILALFGLPPLWNVATDAIAVGAISGCHNNGLIAGNQVSQTSGNSFFAKMCIHGVQGLYLRQGDYFESGVATSTTCTDCVGPEGSNPSVNEGWDEAWAIGGENEPLFPFNAYAVGDTVDALRGLPSTSSYADMLSIYGTNYAGWDYLFHPNGSPPALYQGSSLPAKLDPYTVYDIDCSGQIGLPSTPVRNTAIVSTCRIQVPASATINLLDVAIAVDWHASNPSNQGIHITGNGLVGNTDCNNGGVEFYTNGSSIHFAAGGDVNDVRLISAWDIEWAANANGQVGIAAEAINDIILRSNTQFGLCPGGIANGPRELTYRLVR